MLDRVNCAPTERPTATTVFQSIATSGWSCTINPAFLRAVGPSSALSYSLIVQPSASASVVIPELTVLNSATSSSALPNVTARFLGIPPEALPDCTVALDAALLAAAAPPLVVLLR